MRCLNAARAAVSRMQRTGEELIAQAAMLRNEIERIEREDPRQAYYAGAHSRFCHCPACQDTGLCIPDDILEREGLENAREGVDK